MDNPGVAKFGMINQLLKPLSIFEGKEPRLGIFTLS